MDNSFSSFTKDLLKEKVKIFFISISAGALGILLSLLFSDVFRSTAVVKVSQSDDQLGGISRNLEGLASLAGADIPSTQVKSPEYVKEVLESVTFFRELDRRENIIPQIFASTGFDKSENIILFDRNTYDSANKSWVRNERFMMPATPSYEEAHYFFLDSFNVSVDRKTGFIKISFDHYSPYFAEEFLDNVILTLNDIEREKDMLDSQESINYLKEISATTTNTAIKESLIFLLQDQIKKNMLTTVKSNYLVDYIEEPTLPWKKIFPSKAVFGIFGFLLALTLCICFYLAKFLYVNRVG